MVKKRVCSIILLLSMVFMLSACVTDTINTSDLTEQQDSMVTDLVSAEKDADIQEEREKPVELDVNSSFEVHYLDVGQADAALVLCDDETMLIDGGNPGETIEFAVATSALKHTVEGDYNRVSVAEIEKLAGGDGSGRVQR